MNKWFFIALTGLIYVAFCSAAQAANDWANKEGREEMVLIFDGKLDEAIKRYQVRLADDPNRQEALFGLALAHSQKGEEEMAMSFVRRALDAGLAFERFIVGPRKMLKALNDLSAFKALKSEKKQIWIHGPIVGAVTDHSARFWVRTESPASFAVEMYPVLQGRRSKSILSETVLTSEQDDFTATVEVGRLKADQVYRYRLLLDGRLLSDVFQFRTFPKQHRSSVFKVAFGGGAAYTPEYERVFTTIKSHHPISFLQLGDNIYVDQPEKRAIQRYCYYRRQSSVPYRSLVSSVSTASIWDDHDFGDDDCWYGDDPDSPDWKRTVLKTFQENWNNHSYGDGAEAPGCFHDFYIGDVHFFMLDCRYYRTNPKVAEGRTMLGESQKEWLFNALKRSNGTFKIIASSVPFASGVKPGSRDPWDGYPEEREAIFSYIQHQKIEGVALIAADRHRSDIWEIERPDAYPLYEFMSSRLTNIHIHKVMEKSLFGYNAKRSFGLLSFDTTLKDPSLTYHIQSVDDEPIYRHTLRLSELQIED
ncbi:alkaline phosphatase D family protein [bacterium]|nr:alkaline phosphatase D family protein [bacterium]